MVTYAVDDKKIVTICTLEEPVDEFVTSVSRRITKYIGTGRIYNKDIHSMFENSIHDIIMNTLFEKFNTYIDIDNRCIKITGKAKRDTNDIYDQKIGEGISLNRVKNKRARLENMLIAEVSNGFAEVSEICIKIVISNEVKDYNDIY